MKISKETFDKVFPAAQEGIYEAISKKIEMAGCYTKEQQAMFLAQYGHETGGFRVFVENLNYSKTGLLNVFSKYFTPITAGNFARQAEAIANRVYANRMGNGDERSGHGYKYRGRGLPMLTGRANYIAFEKWLGRDIKPEQVGTDPELIVLAGIWYWQNRRLANYKTVASVTKLINGGTNGLADREAKYKRLMAG